MSNFFKATFTDGNMRKTGCNNLKEMDKITYNFIIFVNGTAYGFLRRIHRVTAISSPLVMNYNDFGYFPGTFIDKGVHLT